ncbi:MAG: phospholipase C [Terriglobales bacterium]
MKNRTGFPAFAIVFALVLVIIAILALGSCTGLTGGRNNPANPGITAVNHVVILLQENRSFDSYFGKLNDYRAANGISGTVDGLGANGFTNISPVTGAPVSSYHSGSVCMENMSPDWAESHADMNIANPADFSAFKMDGFVNTAAGIAAFDQFLDLEGRRAMGFYTERELNYYYFMASNFAVGDRFYSPVPANTTNNRLYMFAATSQGTVHTPNGAEYRDPACVNSGAPGQLTAKTIWQLLTENNISWKIYISDLSPECSGGGPTPACLTHSTYLQFFTWINNNATAQANIVPVSQYFGDVANGTLPSVAFIETGSFSGRDEHPSGKDLTKNPPVQIVIDIQSGAAYASSLINALMNSPSWKDSVFFFAFDEAGGAFDHVPPMAVPNPDGIRPILCLPKDVAVGGDFTITGFRVPNMVISPFTKKNFVSHTPMDYTAMLKFIEARWNLPSLTRRDAAMPDMTEFFDFTGKPWAAPPAPPAQVTGGACNFALE